MNTAAMGRDERVASTPLIKRLMARPELGAVAGTILVFIFFGIVGAGSGMFSALGIVTFLDVSAQLGIIAVAAATLMIGGEFDLSVGSMIGFAGMVMAILAVQYGVPLVARHPDRLRRGDGLRGPQRLHRRPHGPALLHRHLRRPLHPARPDDRLHPAHHRPHPGLGPEAAGRPRSARLALLGQGRSTRSSRRWPMPTSSRPATTACRSSRACPSRSSGGSVITAVCTWILLRTKLGNWIFACGGDPNAARNVGVPVNKVKIGLFMFTAFAATVFACVQTLSVGSADVLRGDLQEFQAIIAAVIGGCLLTGGYGSAIGAAFGALIFGTVQQGIFYTGANTDWFKVFLGVMLLIAVLFNSYIRKKATESR